MNMQNTNLKPFAAYCRVSTDRQKEEETIEVQKTFINDWASKNNAVIIKWYLDDGWSGDRIDRPELDKLRDEAGGEWQGVIFIDRDRLARTLAYQEYVIRELSEKEIEVVFINNPLADDAQGRILQQFYGIVAELERITTAERMRKGKIHKARSGKLVGHTAPYGYRYILKTGDKDGYFEVYEPEAEIVKMIFHWVADRGYSIYRVVKELYNLGIMPAKKKKEYWPKSSIARMLNREDYIGTSYYNRGQAILPKHPLNVEKYKRIKKSSRKLRPRSEWIAITVPAIIDKDLFDRAHKRMRENFLYHKRNKHYDYLLTGKVMCACGAKRVGDGVNGHHYYRCAQRIYKYPLPNKCVYEGVNAEILDAMVWNKLLTLFAHSSLIKSQAQKWKKKQGGMTNQSTEELKRKKAVVAKLADEQNRYLKAYAAEIIDFEQFKENMHEVKAKKEAIELQIKDYKDKAPDDAISLDSLDDICDTLFYSLKYASASDKQEYVRKLIVSIYVGERSNALVNGRIPLITQGENIQYESKYSNRWLAECWQIYSV